MKEQVLVEILVGLPASGKTHYAQTANNGKKFLSTYNEKTCYIDFDRDYNKNKSIETILRQSDFPRGIQQHNLSWNHWIIDGLFLTNESQKNLVAAMFTTCKMCRIFDDFIMNIRFVYFKENREACLFNDSIRDPERHAHITIQNAKLEHPKLKELSEQFGYPYFDFIIKELEVHQMNEYESKFKIHEFYEEPNIMRSEEWCNGGTWGNYLGDSGTIDAEDKPSEFKELDDLLLDICPNITLLQYKKLYRETVSIGERDDSDWYGGHCTYSYYKCDLKKLYDLLTEMKLIEK